MKTIHKVTDNIAEVMREIFETTEKSMITKVGKTLMQGDLDSTPEWKKQQLKLNSKLKKSFITDSKRVRLLIRNAIIKAAELGDFNPDTLLKRADKQTSKLINNALLLHRTRVRKVLRLEKTKPLQKAIFAQTQAGISEGIPVVYKDGRTIGYKEYMEMNVRTTVQSEISERQIELNRITGVVFYIVNSFNDCADDHKDYQGKVYYDERWKSFNLNEEIKDRIETFISSNRLLSIQEVRNKDPYLTTRPNCRHTFNALSVDQALENTPERLLDSLNLKTGSYRPDNYDDTQEQRKNERLIRQYKARKKYNEELYQEKPTQELKRQIQKDSALVRKWQEKQRGLVRKNPNLRRDYRRETKEILVQDLGARYNVGR